MRKFGLIGLGAAMMLSAMGCATNGGNSGAPATSASGSSRIALPAASASATSDADTDFCSCAYKRKHLDPVMNSGFFEIQGPFKTGEILPWCRINDPDNDARIAKLLSSKGVVFTYPFAPFGKSGLQCINVEFPEQQDCSKRLLSEAVARGEIKVVFESFESVAKRATDGNPSFYYLVPPGVYGTPTTKP